AGSRGFALTSDGRYLLNAGDASVPSPRSFGADKLIHVWELPPATARAVPAVDPVAPTGFFTPEGWKGQGHTGPVRGLAFTPDGKRILSVGGQGDNSLRLRDAATGTEMKLISCHSDAVTGVALTPDGRAALTCSADGTLALSDLATGRTVRQFTGHSNGVAAVALSPD